MRRWLFFALAVPLGGWLLDRLANEIARRRGEGVVTRAMRAPRAHRLAHRHR
jgi:hypothetical protein